ncbi:unnamed protein product [Urochloa decumbens]|uniref:Uncharacterized protein n=1 Tax=Urochloa decumbens TaxID=240449 RepID=A0ABC8Z4R1_9POAL
MEAKDGAAGAHRGDNCHPSLCYRIIIELLFPFLVFVIIFYIFAAVLVIIRACQSMGMNEDNASIASSAQLVGVNCQGAGAGASTRSGLSGIRPARARRQRAQLRPVPRGRRRHGLVRGRSPGARPHSQLPRGRQGGAELHGERDDGGGGRSGGPVPALVGGAEVGRMQLGWPGWESYA